jgi:hypothetical protein
MLRSVIAVIPLGTRSLGPARTPLTTIFREQTSNAESVGFLQMRYE